MDLKGTLTKLKKKNGYQILVVKSKEDLNCGSGKFTFKKFKVKIIKLLKPEEIRIKINSDKMHIHNGTKLLQMVLKDQKINWKLGIVKRELLNTSREFKELTNGNKLKFFILEIQEQKSMDAELSEEEKVTQNKKLQLEIINTINSATKSRIAEAYENSVSNEVQESTKKELNKKRKFENI
jgi:hypothetical protein